MPHDRESLDFFLKERARTILDRPRMYAPSPDAMEAMLGLLDEILIRFGAHSSNVKKYQRFGEYLISHGSGSASYCQRQRLDNPDVPDDDIWEGLTSVWNQYFENSHFTE